MSRDISTSIWGLQLPPTTKIILLKLAYHADNDGRNAYPSVATIATECCVSERTVQYTLRKLVKSGLISVQKEADRRQPTTYRINPHMGEKIAPQKESGVQLTVVQGCKVEQSGVQPIAPKGYPERDREEKDIPTPLPPTQSAVVAMLGCETIPIWTYYSGEKRLTPNQARQLSNLETRAAERGLDPAAVVREAADAATSADGGTSRWNYFRSVADRIIRGDPPPKKPVSLHGQSKPRAVFSVAADEERRRLRDEAERAKGRLVM